MEGYVQIVVTIVGVLGSASIWKYMEARLKARAVDKQTDLNNNDTVQFRDDLKARVARLEQLLEESNEKVIVLTAEVHELRTEVKFLTKENERLKDK